MWEFSIKMDSAKTGIAKFLYRSLAGIITEVEGVITSYEEEGKISIVLACKEIEKSRLQYHISDCISKVICIYMKEDFLEKRLKIPQKPELEIYTFKKALVSFDRETDRFLINKYLNLDKNIVIESFFHFKLQPLKEKWSELIKIANDNSTYLLSDDSFVELLKFLVDNIEIASDELNIEIEDEKIKILNSNYNSILEDKLLTEFDIVEQILSLSPRKINWLSDKKIPFIEKVFSKRLLYVSENDFSKKDFNKNWGLQNT